MGAARAGVVVGTVVAGGDVLVIYRPSPLPPAITGWNASHNFAVVLVNMVCMYLAC